MKKKKRVRVFDGAGEKLLGLGTLVGTVTTYGLVSPNQDQIISSENPEDKLPEISESGWTLVAMSNNPKIVLDDGKVVYGCQVWWEDV